MSGDVLCEAHGHGRLIALGRPALNRPAKMSSLDFEANDALVERKRGIPGAQAGPVTEDLAEGNAAFRERRPARFESR